MAECKDCKVEAAGFGYKLTLCPLHTDRAETYREALKRIAAIGDDDIVCASDLNCPVCIARAALAYDAFKREQELATELAAAQASQRKSERDR